MNGQSKLFPVIDFLLLKYLGILADHLAENWVILGGIHSHKHLIGNAHERFPMFDCFGSLYTYKTALKVARVLYFGKDNTIFLTPLSKYLAFSSMFKFPIFNLLFFFILGLIWISLQIFIWISFYHFWI